jgi:hypothetical protein
MQPDVHSYKVQKRFKVDELLIFLIFKVWLTFKCINVFP